jgi:lysophospholipase L1-like esterase
MNKRSFLAKILPSCVVKAGSMCTFIGMLTFSSSSAQDPNFHVYICFGQSNMEGSAAFEAQDIRNVSERFKVLQAVDCPDTRRSKGQWYTGVPPLTRCNTGLTPIDYFGRSLIAALPEKVLVGVVVVAVGGCKIELYDSDNAAAYTATAPDWMKGMIAQYQGNPYAQLVALAKTAQQKGVIKGILLHQGESNTGDSTWVNKVNKVYHNLLKDLNLKEQNVPLLAGEVVHAEQNGKCASMNGIIDLLPKTIPTAHVISSKGCSVAKDNLHFDAAGYRELGRRYAATMLNLLNNNHQGR